MKFIRQPAHSNICISVTFQRHSGYIGCAVESLCLSVREISLKASVIYSAECSSSLQPVECVVFRRVFLEISRFMWKNKFRCSAYYHGKTTNSLHSSKFHGPWKAVVAVVMTPRVCGVVYRLAV